jgi:hypothetical protein
MIIALSSDKSLSAWDDSTYNIIDAIPCNPNVFRLIMPVNSEYFITAGVDLKLYSSNLKTIFELNRTNRENSIKLMIKIRNERIVIASNFDIEIYGLAGNSIQQRSPSTIPNAIKNLETLSSQISENGIRIRELKRYLNSHQDTILTLVNISG